MLELKKIAGTKGVQSGARSFKIAIDMLNENSNLKWKTKKDLKAEGEKSQYTCELGIVSGYFPHLAPCLGIYLWLHFWVKKNS